MDRRELLRMIAVVTGGAVIGGELFLSGCSTGAKSAAEGFTAENIALLDEVGETIIPATATPGAKAAKIGEFMKVWVTDCYTEAQQKAFMEGIGKLEDACKKAYKKSFMECSPEQRHELLVGLEKEAKEFNKAVEEKDKPAREKIEAENKKLAWKDHKEVEATPHHYYTLMKQMTLFGFFTSKTGCTETLQHIAVPGKYDGAVPYVKGGKAWAE